MYKQSNQRYSEGGSMNSMNPYPPPPGGSIPSSKMHLDGFSSNIPPPLYYDAPNNYQYVLPGNPSLPPPPDNYNWRDVSESKGPVPLNTTLPPSSSVHNSSTPPGHFNVSGQGEFPGAKLGEPFFMQGSGGAPQVNIVQRLSGIIKTQLSGLQGLLSYADKKTQQERNKKEQRSRSRSRDRGDRDRRRQEKQHRQWICPRCSFLNFDFRDRCKKCNESKPDEKQAKDGFRNYTPGPEDWRCSKCNNINYARRTECHRCHTSKNK